MKTFNVLILVLFLSCYSYGQHGYLIDSSVVIFNGNVNPTTIYTYDADENLTSIVRGQAETLIAYPNDSTVVTEVYVDGSLTSVQTDKNRPDGLPATVEFTDGLDNLTSRDTFFYNSSGQETSFISWNFDNGVGYMNDFRTTTWDGNNQLALEQLVSDNNMDTVFYRSDVFTYDSEGNQITSNVIYIDPYVSDVTMGQKFYINNVLDSSYSIRVFDNQFITEVYEVYSYDGDFGSIETFQKNEFGTFSPIRIRDNWYNNTNVFVSQDSSHTYTYDGAEFVFSGRGTQESWEPTSETLNLKRTNTTFGANPFNFEVYAYYHKSSTWVATEEVEILEDLIAYPNPIVKNSTLVLNNTHSDTRTVKIFDIDGRLINCVSVMSGKNNIVSPYHSGVYFIQLFDKTRPVSNLKTIVVE